jgi:5-methyltetrahydrofolate--homocysteine methyltransferase
MIIVGEKLNSSIPKTLEAMQTSNDEYLISLIRNQAEAGADYIDINTALLGDDEFDYMVKLAKLVIENTDCGIMLDSPNPDIIARCIPIFKDSKIIVNSVNCEEKYNSLIEMIAKYSVGAVALLMDGRRIPNSAEQRLSAAKKIISKLREAGVKDENIYADALTEAIATNSEAATVTLDTIRLLRGEFPAAHIICGLSNVSFGLPSRAYLNSAFLSMANAAGLDSVIADITSESLKNALFASEALLGKDEYCMEYINFIRAQKAKAQI